MLGNFSNFITQIIENVRNFLNTYAYAYHHLWISTHVSNHGIYRLSAVYLKVCAKMPRYVATNVFLLHFIIFFIMTFEACTILRKIQKH